MYCEACDRTEWDCWYCDLEVCSRCGGLLKASEDCGDYYDDDPEEDF